MHFMMNYPVFRILWCYAICRPGYQTTDSFNMFDIHTHIHYTSYIIYIWAYCVYILHGQYRYTWDNHTELSNIYICIYICMLWKIIFDSVYVFATKKITLFDKIAQHAKYSTLQWILYVIICVQTWNTNTYYAFNNIIKLFYRIVVRAFLFLTIADTGKSMHSIWGSKSNI